MEGCECRAGERAIAVDAGLEFGDALGQDVEVIAAHRLAWVREESQASMSHSRHPTRPGDRRIGSGNSPRRRILQIVAGDRPVISLSFRGDRMQLSADVVSW